MAVQVVQELVTKFGFVGSIKPLNNYNVAVADSIKVLGVMAGATITAAGAFAIWAQDILSGLDSLGALSSQTKIAASSIQELNYIAGQTQSDAGSMESSLQSLTKTIGTAALTGSEDFARLGISVRDASGQVKTADKVLDEIRQRFVALGLSISEQEHFASALGIDNSLLQMLGKTNAEMDSMRDRAREMGVVTGEQVKQSEAYKRSLNGMWFALNSVKQIVGVGMAPELTRMADIFTELLINNKKLIIEGLRIVTIVLGDLMAALVRLTPVILAVVAIFTAWQLVSIGLAGVLGAIFSPIVLVTALVIGLLLVVDDLIVAFQGGESVIASFFKNAFDIDIVKELTAAFEVLSSVASDVWDVISNLFGGIADLLTGNFSEGLDKMLSALKSFSGVIGTILGPLFTSPASVIPATIQQAAPTTIPQSMSTSGASVDNRSVQQSVDITVMSPNPEAAGRAVQDSLQKQLDNASIQLATGGR